MATCILIHGFTGSPYEVEPLSQHLRAQGHQVLTPILAGHDASHFRPDIQWQEWIDSVEKVVCQACERREQVILAGFSMGGMIAIYLANRYPIQKLILLSASVYYPNLPQMWQNIKTHGLNHHELKATIASGEELQRYLQKVKQTPLRWVWQFNQLVRHCRPEIEQVEVPTLIIQGEQDNLVPPHSAHYLYQSIAAEEKYLHFLPRSKHIVCHDCEQTKIFQYVDQFLQ